jgi:hypothetical protein
MVIPCRIDIRDNILYTDRRTSILHPPTDLDRLTTFYIHTFDPSPFQIASFYEIETGHPIENGNIEREDTEVRKDLATPATRCFLLAPSILGRVVSRQ